MPKSRQKAKQGKLKELEYVEGEQAYDNFVNLTKRLISVPKSDIVEMERSRKKKKI